MKQRKQLLRVGPVLAVDSCRDGSQRLCDGSPRSRSLFLVGNKCRRGKLCLLRATLIWSQVKQHSGPRTPLLSSPLTNDPRRTVVHNTFELNCSVQGNILQLPPSKPQDPSREKKNKTRNSKVSVQEGQHPDR